MSYYVTQDDINVLEQNEKIITVGIEVLNGEFKTIGNLTGALKSMSLSIDASSDVRRTGTLELFPEFDGYEISSDSSLWMNKYIRIKLYFKIIRTGQLIEYLMGTFVIDSKTFSYDVSNDSLSVSLVDLMSLLDGTHAGTLSGDTNEIPKGSNISEAMRDTIKQLSSVNYFDNAYYTDLSLVSCIIDEISSYSDEKENTVPYDLKIENDVTVLNIITQLRDLYPGYETYFDTYGIFHCNKIPTCKDDSNTLTADVIQNYINIFSENRPYKFSDVKNIIGTYGIEYSSVSRLLDSDNTTLDGMVFNATLKDYTSYTDMDLFALKLPKSQDSKKEMTINVNNLGAKAIKIENNNNYELLKDGFLKADNTYIFRYNASLDAFIYLCPFQPKGLAVLFKEQPKDFVIESYKEFYNCKNFSYVVDNTSPFGVDAIGDRYLKVDSSDTAYIASDSSAIDYAEYMLWEKSRMLNEITITCDIIPFLDVNQKFTYKHQKSGLCNTYITKKIDFEISESSAQTTITAVLFNDLYPDVINATRSYE